MTYLYVTWLIRMWHDSFPRVVRLVHIWHDSFIRVTWRLSDDSSGPFDMTHSYMWRDSSICDMPHSYVTWLFHTCDMTSHRWLVESMWSFQRRLGHGATQISRVFRTWGAWHVSFMCVTWLVMWIVHVWLGHGAMQISRVFTQVSCVFGKRGAWHDSLMCDVAGDVTWCDINWIDSFNCDWAIA